MLWLGPVLGAISILTMVTMLCLCLYKLSGKNNICKREKQSLNDIQGNVGIAIWIPMDVVAGNNPAGVEAGVQTPAVSVARQGG